jgi:hypothetical protein
MDATAAIGGMLTTMGVWEGPAADMSTGLVQIAVDLADLRGADPSAMINAMQMALAGNARGLREYGFDVDDAAARTRAAEMGLMGLGGQVSNAAMAQARYSLIVEQAAGATGHFAQNAGDADNAAAIMTARFEDLKASIGSGLLPVILPFMEGFSNLLAIFNRMADDTAPVVNAFNNLALSGRDIQRALEADAQVFIDLADSIGRTLGPLGDFLSMLSRIPGRIHIEMPDLSGLRVPGFAAGGVVPGATGAAQLALVHGGETITPAGATTNSLVVNFYGATDYAAARDGVLSAARQLGLGVA